MPNIYFQKRIKSLREKSNLTMQQLADLMKVTKSRVNMWENNGTVPRMETLIDLAKYFSVSTNFLLGNDDTNSISANNTKLSSLQRNLGKLNDKELEQAEGMLKAVFIDIFNDEDEDDDI